MSFGYNNYGIHCNVTCGHKSALLPYNGRAQVSLVITELPWNADSVDLTPGIVHYSAVLSHVHTRMQYCM